jgi:hypothetical protein
MTNIYIYRARSSWVWCIVLWSLLATILIFEIVYQNWDLLLVSVLNALAAGYLSYALVLRAKITFADEGLELTNPWIKIFIGYELVTDVVTRYAFTVKTESKDFSSWAAVASSRGVAKHIRPTDLLGTGLNPRNPLALSDSPRTDTGQAAIIALRRIDAARIAGTGTSELKRSISWLQIALSVSSAAVLAYSLLH